ncbi:MAG: LytR/AlgR family response regulator transcription factor [Bacteroidales bacterium]
MIAHNKTKRSTLAIIEDDQSERDNIRNIISHYFESIEIVGEADSVADGLELINSQKPEILILDIHLKDGDSFELLQKINHLDFYIIWLTAHEEYAIKAFKISAIDYLLKPYKGLQLADAIKKATDKISLDQHLVKLETLIHNIYSKTSKQIVIHTTDAFFVVDTSDIIRCMADNNYTHIFLENGKKIVVSKPLKKYEELLRDAGFCRVHQSHLVNLCKLARLNRSEKSTLILKNNDTIPVSKGMKAQILSYLKNLDC